MDWPRIFASITGTVGQELLLRNEYLAAENRILRDQVKRHVSAQGASWQSIEAERGHFVRSRSSFREVRPGQAAARCIAEQAADNNVRAPVAVPTSGPCEAGP